MIADSGRREFLLGSAGLAIAFSANPALSSVGDFGAIRRVEQGLLERTRLEEEAPRTFDLRARMSFFGVTGLQVAIIDGSRLVWSGTYGVTQRRGGRRVDPQTLFQPGSVGKALTAFAALRLVDQAVLGLDADVNDWLRGWHVPANRFTAEQPVTLRTLLNHSAGFNAAPFYGYRPGDHLPGIAQILGGQPPANSPAAVVDQRPGAAFRYANLGYLVVQQLLEDVTGARFRDLMRELVRQPLGMTRSTYDLLRPIDAPNAARGHRADGSMLPFGWYMLPEAGAAGLWSTAADLTRFVLAVQAARAGRGLISPALTREMFTKGPGPYGLGIELVEESPSRFLHGGGTEGYRAYMIGFSDLGRGIVVLSNSDIGNQLMGEILRAVALEYGWNLYPQRVRRAVAPRGSVRDYVGRYRLDHRDQPVLTVGTDATGQLVADAPVWEGWALPRQMYAAGEDIFFFREHPGEFQFERGADGQPNALRLRNFFENIRGVRI